MKLTSNILIRTHKYCESGNQNPFHCTNKMPYTLICKIEVFSFHEMVSYDTSRRPQTHSTKRLAGQTYSSSAAMQLEEKISAHVPRGVDPFLLLGSELKYCVSNITISFKMERDIERRLDE